ncbi:hypothetical protein BN7_4599 [Wickerhamomyces ciferrii]|uniref:Uncharacterized protein n=1 Tax=Wickerhamomyces ciferrii (strain ATCC 14091 / BCRC 22168 / CBS 111 / JCM 3599 / NBRC 0793 / NRRL Y-1031 F-60-10) TaxID=1206466 RepID=K0KIH2_WICCF|nr:uncharacterized protein BN7_4599 [Wickerhamomyces ciferrii]CCH45020.1 hypothetical protein BN7_4599 [Wickerhamomyces ciferrii]
MAFRIFSTVMIHVYGYYWYLHLLFCCGLWFFIYCSSQRDGFITFINGLSYEYPTSQQDQLDAALALLFEYLYVLVKLMLHACYHKYIRIKDSVTLYLRSDGSCSYSPTSVKKTLENSSIRELLIQEIETYFISDKNSYFSNELIIYLKEMNDNFLNLILDNFKLQLQLSNSLYWYCENPMDHDLILPSKYWVENFASSLFGIIKTYLNDQRANVELYNVINSDLTINKYIDCVLDVLLTSYMNHYNLDSWGYEIHLQEQHLQEQHYTRFNNPSIYYQDSLINIDYTERKTLMIDTIVDLLNNYKQLKLSSPLQKLYFSETNLRKMCFLKSVAPLRYELQLHEQCKSLKISLKSDLIKLDILPNAARDIIYQDFGYISFLANSLDTEVEDEIKKHLEYFIDEVRLNKANSFHEFLNMAAANDPTSITLKPINNYSNERNFNAEWPILMGQKTQC